MQNTKKRARRRRYRKKGATGAERGEGCWTVFNRDTKTRTGDQNHEARVTLNKHQLNTRGHVKLTHRAQKIKRRKESSTKSHDRQTVQAGPSGFFAPIFPPVKLLWINGNTPPPAIVARTSVSSSSSPRIASCKCRGVMRLTRRSFDALPVFSKQCSEHRTEMGKKHEEYLQALGLRL